MSKKKCSKIHVGKKNLNCPELKVHESDMKNSDKEKYLGDQLNKNAKNKETIDDRKSKGYGIVSEIMAILSEIPLGKYRVDIGLKLRQAMLVNGILFNSEGWHSVTEEDIRTMEKVDEALLRSILQTHPKTPLEFLYLESGSISIRHILSSRRINFLRTILERDEEELTKRVLREQQSNPSDGDFIELVKKDLEKCEIVYDEDFITMSRKEHFKRRVKQQIGKAALNDYLNKQKSHSKVKSIKYDKLEAQSYLKSKLFTNEEVSLLTALRSHTVRGVRCNFKNMYKDNTQCPLNCSPLSPLQDTQEHMLHCSKLDMHNVIAANAISYNDIYGDFAAQKSVTSVYTQLVEKRNKLLEEQQPN